ncbi:MAG: hypothetical protein VKL39_23580, partial [Leptolyngbyaceae bacterium]|nr:hypothetical protein [Leptolyngbyaceae bacterium]
MPESRGRYQSRILSFLSQQSLQLRDRILQNVRQAQFNVSWGVQVILYPVYVLFQTGRLVGRQLRAAGQRLAPLLEAVKADDFDPAIGVPPLDVDAPFKGVLDSLRTLDLPIDLPIEMCSEASTEPSLALPSGSDDQNSDSSLVAQPSSNLLNASLVIRGVASSLETRHLILTNVDNQGLDILTVEQQHWLYQRIAFEVASYCRSEALILRARVAGALPEGDRPNRIPLSWRFLPLLRHKETTASPIRFFRALMEWMQASPLAMSANLFQEAALPMLGSYQPPEP